MKFDQKVMVGSEFTICKFNEEGEITYQGKMFKNTVLDCGLLSLYTYSFKAMTAWINLGASDTPVDTTQTGLLDRKFSTNTIYNSQNWAITSQAHDNIYCGQYTIFQFNIGTCTGSHKEIGLSYANNSTYLNRQLIKDAQGNPMDLVVAANEGLRITVETKLYADKTIKPYSCIYHFDAQGATAGEFVLTNGVKSKYIPIADLYALTGTIRDTHIEYITGNLTVAFVIRDWNNPEAYYIYFHAQCTVDPNLSLSSHNLTGGSGEPIFTEVLAYDQTTNFPDQSFTCLNVTTTEVTNHQFKKKLYFAQHYDTVYAWGIDSNNFAAFWNRGFNSLRMLAVKSGVESVNPSSISITKTPTINDLSFTVKSYYAPGTIATTANVNVDTFRCRLYNNDVAFEVPITPSITLNTTEEFEYEFTFSWGRYTS